MFFYNLQIVPFKNILKYKCSIFGGGKWLLCTEPCLPYTCYKNARLYTVVSDYINTEKTSMFKCIYAV